MKDLKSQLAEAFGLEVPAEAPAEPPGPPDILSERAHLDSQWLACLRRLAEQDPSVKLAPQPKLGQARQATDQLLRALKRAGRRRELGELKKLRDDFYARRDRAAWAALKERFKERGLSEKAYRALKQEGADPIQALAKLERADPDALRELGARRLRELLTAP